MLRVARQTRIENSRNNWVLVKHSGERNRIRHMCVNPQRQRFQSSQDQPRVEWTDRSPESDAYVLTNSVALDHADYFAVAGEDGTIAAPELNDEQAAAISSYLTEGA
jgi:hypothetical protein